MDIKKAYAVWSVQYDTNNNKTRDLEALTLRKMLDSIPFDIGLEIGCGTGKNTAWLMTKASQITAVDLSPEMLAKAKEKITSGSVQFIQADIKNSWTFGENYYDLVTFSLVLEHIQHLDPIFQEVSKSLKPGGYVYIGELHPFKQYAGTKARYETENGIQEVECYTHHISAFFDCAKKYNFEIAAIHESFDDNDRTGMPRILALLLKKT
ncbi:MAG: ubiquinone/menaquinone biosynthesis C-methylase UbiE [Saprospiraceae bacterium]|jgi:ubiquinone/menaquinone biosynthesis C-methylase UbiE